MYTPAERDRILADLIAGAQSDPNVTAAALVGGSARGDQDRWSDIDLALRLAEGWSVEAVAAEWTAAFSATGDVVHTVDVWAGPALYRVFLLSTSLQVDISFWPADRFAATSPQFRLLFGEAKLPQTSASPTVDTLIGMAWLYALHVRSSLARDRTWQARLFLDSMRQQLVMVACIRRGLPSREGRGVDQLPAGFLHSLGATLASANTPTELRVAFRATVDLLDDEIRNVDVALASRLAVSLATMLATTDGVLADDVPSVEPAPGP